MASCALGILAWVGLSHLLSPPQSPEVGGAYVAAVIAPAAPVAPASAPAQPGAGTPVPEVRGPAGSPAR
jgi:hypothetical protein